VTDCRLIGSTFGSVVYSGWLVDGGEVGHGCGLVDRKLSVVFSGEVQTRRLCTPPVDLRHVASVHFWFSFGTLPF